METKTQTYLRYLRERVPRELQHDYIASARYILNRHRALCAQVLEEIGMYTSSEPELAALQRVY